MDRFCSSPAGRTRVRLGVSLALLLTGAVNASVIDSTSFFGSIPRTVINFETDGVGNVINLIQGQSLAMPLNAYSNLGVTFVNQVRWVNDGNAAFDAAQLAGGSPMNAIPSSMVNTFSFTFGSPVRAFGMFVANNRTVDPAGPTFTAYNAGGQVIETVQFGGALIDGTIVAGPTTADYGFMGLFTTQDIARVEVTKQAAIIDDLYFSQIPAPGAAALLGIVGVMGLRRRR